MYDYFMTRSEICEMKARLYAEAGDTKLTQFYMNASYGFKIKARELSVEVAISTNED